LILKAVAAIPKAAKASKKVPNYEPWSAERAAQIIAEHRDLEGPLLPILHALQETFGCVTEDAVPIVAEALNLSRAEVHGVATFYHDFRRQPAGRHVLKLCRAESCQAAGGEALAASAEKRLGIAFGDTTADGRVTLEPIYCLGLCSVPPSAMIDGRIVGRVDADKLEALIAETDR
jgi:formate dehydrogenase subunit gamma